MCLNNLVKFERSKSINSVNESIPTSSAEYGQ